MHENCGVAYLVGLKINTTEFRLMTAVRRGEFGQSRAESTLMKLFRARCLDINRENDEAGFGDDC